MSIHFHPLRIKDIRKETADCVSVAFEVPKELAETFQFSQGQSLTLRTEINGEETRRTYSICSSPLDNELRVAIKKVQGGIFSSFANHDLRKGDTLEVMPPVGKFYTPLDPAHQKTYIAVAAGSGITPILALIKTTLATEPRSNFTLIYGNRNRSSIIFFEELEALKNRYMSQFRVIHVLSRERMDTPLNFGRINAAKMEELEGLLAYPAVDEFYICGPEEMIFSVKDFLEARGVSRRKIHFELFTTPGQATRAAVLNQETSKDAMSHVTIKVDGRSIEFDLPMAESTNLLDAALAQGADLPYACKGGVCCTCKARVLEGQVSMDVHWGLEEEEIAQGYILTCQSHPLTPALTVDFDVK